MGRKSIAKRADIQLVKQAREACAGYGIPFNDEVLERFKECMVEPKVFYALLMENLIAGDRIDKNYGENFLQAVHDDNRDAAIRFNSDDGSVSFGYDDFDVNCSTIKSEDFGYAMARILSGGKTSWQ